MSNPYYTIAELRRYDTPDPTETFLEDDMGHVGILELNTIEGEDGEIRSAGVFAYSVHGGLGTYWVDSDSTVRFKVPDDEVFEIHCVVEYD